MDTLQAELESTHPVLNIQLYGINEKGLDFSNEAVTAGRDLPWLQDVDANENGQSDVWYDLWDVTYRDVVVLDGDNVKFGTYNLTINDLADEPKYAEFRQLLLDAAVYTQKPWTNPIDRLDVDQNGSVQALDVLNIINKINSDGSGKLPPPTTELPPRRYDCSGDNIVSALDAIQVINFINARTETTVPAMAEGEGGIAPLAIQDTGQIELNSDQSLAALAASNPLASSPLGESVVDSSGDGQMAVESFDQPDDRSQWQRDADALFTELNEDLADDIPAATQFGPLSSQLLDAMDDYQRAF